MEKKMVQQLGNIKNVRSNGSVDNISVNDLISMESIKWWVS